MSKPSLSKAGFGPSHYRSMSQGQDIARGFGGYSHLTLDHKPRILKAKLAAGFPHLAISVPVEAVDAIDFNLCRFNVAMTRKLRRNGMPGHAESARNGKYYDGHQIPIARSTAEKRAMLQHPLNVDTMIEVLIHGDLALPDTTKLICYSDADAIAAKEILQKLDVEWEVETAVPPSPYPRSSTHAQSVADFVDQAISDPTWRGNGLEFDRL